jgi:hypothetical protein
VLRIFLALKSPTASAGVESANLGNKGQHITPRPPKHITYELRLSNSCIHLETYINDRLVRYMRNLCFCL